MLSNNQKNILKIAIAETLITKGKNRGQLKGLLDGDCYDGRSLAALARKKLLTFHINTVFGSGWAATELALRCTG